MDNNRDQIQRSQQGTGSAENKGESRSRQLNRNSQSDQDKQNMSGGLGRDSGQLGNLRDLGALSGRDDSAGGSGDRMENENTGEETDL
jgi:hypothetical protein